MKNVHKSESAEKPVFKNVGECLWRCTQNDIYYALFKRQGKQYRRSLRTKDRKLAERKLAAIRQKINRTAKPVEIKNMPFKILADRFLALRKSSLKPKAYLRLEGAVRQLNRFFGVLSVRAITVGNCHDWEAKRGARLSASAFNTERLALNAILNHAVSEGLLLDNPAERIKRRKLPKLKIVIPSHEQFGSLLHQIRVADSRAVDAARLVELLAYSGMRLAEATAICWSEIDFHRGLFTVTGGDYGTKNHESREVPLFPCLREFLIRLKEETDPGAEDKIISITTARRAITTACRKAGIPKFSHHSFRHFFVSNAIEVGVDFKTIAAWVGHKDGGLLVAKTYGHLRDTHSFDMATRMTGFSNRP